jgi:tRNA(His) 5'-end guanylyltransferase
MPQGLAILFESAQDQYFMDCEAECAYLLIKKMTTATIIRYTNSGLVYVFMFASTQPNELREIQLFHPSLILSRFLSMIT